MGQAVFRYSEEMFSLGRELFDKVRGRPTERPTTLIVGVVDVMPKFIAHAGHYLAGAASRTLTTRTTSRSMLRSEGRW